MSILAPLVMVVFTAINFDAADNFDSSHLMRVKDMPTCYKLQAEYDASMREYNQMTPYAFRLRWASDCKLMVLADHSNHV